ncbi:MAG: two component, sigma54 specific, transcriptional regulator, Fis family [Firmicutes bacterium]|nr:two component, sigma54 specific, transcriptional regulator, Fis family [Bacillota bacterium]MDI6704837.1 sigma-54 dependent transcriptional regulator [Bacillota bacterium]
MHRVLVVDDERHIRWVISRALKAEDLEVVEFENGTDFLENLEKHRPDLVILDLKMPGIDGLEVLRRVKERQRDLPVIMITAHGTIETAIEAMKMGAHDYITKPFDIDELKIQVSRALNMSNLVHEVKYLRDQLESSFSDIELYTKNLKMREIYDMVDRVADTEAGVLITGESGTGKEIIARMIHHKSSRRRKPFISVNCAAIPANLVESEFFGHEKGAFTGAVARKPGKFEQADGGTLFLDEIGELDPSMQAKLLRVIQEKSFERIGGTITIKVDVRIIAATNKNLQMAIENGSFREDLFYRLNVIHIDIPPLRERKEDIPRLVEQFAAKYKRKSSRIEVPPKTMEVLMSHNWPGNIRELENCIERATIVCDGDEILPEHLPFSNTAKAQEHKSSIVNFPDEGVDLEQIEQELIRTALEKSKGNQTRAAKLLNITRSALIYRMQKYGID